MSARLAAEGLTAGVGARTIIRDVTLAFPDRQVTALVGPSGCGKSTLLRCLNRLHETVPGAHLRGRVLLDGADALGAGVDAAALRRRVGMVFQRPTPFPGRWVRDNVAAGVAALGARAPRGAALDARIETELRRVGLWGELRDRLHDDAGRLSGGQQQRLCVARALMHAPEILLLDEPTAALDPQATQRIEELLYALRAELTVVVVTHNLQQAARVSDRTAFLLGGALVEVDDTERVFTAPRDPRTEAFVTGRFG
ncbi:phosphate ABC transporter ATP-binding protein [Roseisolibacter sp. H3M3-2]|uniref:phosphate ABC transporter ATP-binding protein n=1 Tax=Roseisolibacter sp. H3M3-2 TaxID=3031323 RepID=UPI0023DC53EB|nr:phosphate ABC transporter ATP-binding protein [Roseisolibacter sp. H3M3-2]MDF1503260.1 phosphate ABC transporter ATP-binding protein [Roseisolibacter sp. H3M3-2]